MAGHACHVACECGGKLWAKRAKSGALISELLARDDPVPLNSDHIQVV